VLGTRFLVRHFRGASNARVVVEQGKVNVSTHAPGHSNMILAAGDIGDVSD